MIELQERWTPRVVPVRVRRRVVPVPVKTAVIAIVRVTADDENEDYRVLHHRAYRVLLKFLLLKTEKDDFRGEIIEVSYVNGAAVP